MNLKDILIDRLSYWVGFLTASLAWWVWKKSKPVVDKVREALGQKFSALKEGLSASTEQRYRQDMVKILQDKHLAAPLFSLEEIAIPPRLIAPMPAAEPQTDVYPYMDTVELTIPFLPDWPEMAGVYRTPTLTFPQALSGGSDLVVIGKPGSGKSFALQHLAVQIAQRNPEVGSLSNLIPVYLHAADIPLKSSDGPLNAIYKAYYQIVGTLTEAQLPAFLKAVFTEQLALLIIDGMDELSPAEKQPILEYIQRLQEKYPGNRLIITASTDDLSGIENLGVKIVAMAAWGRQEIDAFVERWSDLWHTHTVNESWASQLGPEVDPLVLKGWLQQNPHTHNPLMLTLLTWGAFAGDSRGLTPASALDAYVMRMSANIANARSALEQLAVQMTLSQRAVVGRNTAGKYVASFEDVTAPSDLDQQENIEGLDDFAEDLDALLGDAPPGVSAVDEPSTNPFVMDEELESLLDEIDQREDEVTETISEQNVRRMLPELVKSNMLIYRADSTISLIHPVIQGYLAGSALAKQGGANQLIAQPYWSGKTLAWEYLATQGDVSELARSLFEKLDEDPLKRGLFVASTWTRNAPKTAPWRSNVLRGISRYMQKDEIALRLRLRLVTALAVSGEATIGALFRQMLGQDSPEVQLLGALGCGLAKYEKSVPDLGSLLYAPNLPVNRAASLALVAIGNNAALEAITSALLQASDEVRQAAAEALASHPAEGHAILRDGAEADDILVRRAAAYGLARINQPWTVEILEKLQIDDDQWAVRSAAEQALATISSIRSDIPTPQKNLHETTWILDFAGQLGMGVSNQEAGWTMLKRTLGEGSIEQVLAAMDVYRLYPSMARQVLPELYQLMVAQDTELREGAFNTVWHVGAAGIDLPAPSQLGF